MANVREKARHSEKDRFERTVFLHFSFFPSFVRVNGPQLNASLDGLGVMPIAHSLSLSFLFAPE